MFQREAILEFLKDQDVKIDLYNPNMEVQVNVIPGPNREVKEKGKGIIWSNEEDSWSAFRIPFNAKKDAHYADNIQSWPLYKYAEGIGLTGWDYVNKCSLWVGFDFDSILGHAKGLDDNELDKVRDAIKSIPYGTLRRSKGGKGFHLYIHFARPIPTANHTEHACLAKFILSQLSGLIGFDFNEKADKAGGVLWIWHRKGSKSLKSFEVIKEGKLLDNVPDTWRSFELPAKKRANNFNSEQLDDLLTKTKRVHLDDDHRKLLQWFANRKTLWWWDAELEMLVCHTKDLEDAHGELKCRGIFETISTGRDRPNDQNCFCFPISNGAWVVRRHGLNTQEVSTWVTETNGWTKCFFNRHADLETVSRANDGVKTSKGSFVFTSASKVIEALGALQIYLSVEDEKLLDGRDTTLLMSKDNEIIIRVTRYEEERSREGWAPVRGPLWEKLIPCAVEPTVLEPPDNIIRFAIIGNQEEGWYLYTRGAWNSIGRENIKPSLITLGYAKNDLDHLLGQTIFNAWEIVNIPFAEEYPGNRQWNKSAAQLAFKPSPGTHNTWDMILDHLGKNIDEDVRTNEWCKKYEIINGGHYLRLWITCLIKYPYEPLPYLFFFGDQDIGKSTMHEAIKILFKDGVGCQRCDVALTNKEGFNGELFNSILCVIEEVNLQKSKVASERIKDWVTGKTIGIHPKGSTVFTTRNSTHWIQCANRSDFCPIFHGDTRITVINVESPEKVIPKPVLISMLEQEASAFIHTILTTEVPESDSRLRIPAISTAMKQALQSTNSDSLEEFINKKCVYKAGNVIKFSDFYDSFLRTLDETERYEWSKTKVSKGIPIEKYPKARFGTDGHVYLGNISIVGGIDNPIFIGKVRITHDGYLTGDRHEVNRSI